MNNLLSSTRKMYNEYPRAFWVYNVIVFIDRLGGFMLYPFLCAVSHPKIRYRHGDSKVSSLRSSPFQAWWVPPSVEPLQTVRDANSHHCQPHSFIVQRSRMRIRPHAGIFVAGRYRCRHIGQYRRSCRMSSGCRSAPARQACRRLRHYPCRIQHRGHHRAAYCQGC